MIKIVEISGQTKTWLTAGSVLSAFPIRASTKLSASRDDKLSTYVHDAESCGSSRACSLEYSRAVVRKYFIVVGSGIATCCVWVPPRGGEARGYIVYIPAPVNEQQVARVRSSPTRRRRRRRRSRTHSFPFLNGERSLLAPTFGPNAITEVNRLGPVPFIESQNCFSESGSPSPVETVASRGCLDCRENKSVNVQSVAPTKRDEYNNVLFSVGKVWRLLNYLYCITF